MQVLNGKITVIIVEKEQYWLGYAQCFSSESAYVFITGGRQEKLDKAGATIDANAEVVTVSITEKVSAGPTLCSGARSARGWIFS